MLRSKPGGTRKLCKDGNEFGVNQLCGLFDWEMKKKEESGEVPDFVLTKEAVNPDKWNVQSAFLAKQPFHEKTVTSMILKIAEKLVQWKKSTVLRKENLANAIVS